MRFVRKAKGAVHAIEEDPKNLDFTRTLCGVEVCIRKPRRFTSDYEVRRYRRGEGYVAHADPRLVEAGAKGCGSCELQRKYLDAHAKMAVSS